MIKTATPGVYRRGRKYVVTYRDRDGRQRKESVLTLEEAKLLKHRREVESKGGINAGRSISFHEYAGKWCDELPKQGARRDRTNRDYVGQMERYVLVYFDSGTRLGDIRPGDVDRFVGWLMRPEDARKRLATPTVRRILVPFRMCLEQARRDGLIEGNPVDNVRVPRGPRKGRARSYLFRSKALSRWELAKVIESVPAEHQLFFRTLAATGARWSEATAWQKKDFHPTEQILKVRRTLSAGVEYEPKTEKSRRDIPISAALRDDLLDHVRLLDDEDLIFGAGDNKPLSYDKMKKQVLYWAAAEAGVEWMGFHTLRHTAASILFDNGCNLKEVQEFLGHSTPGFTLNTYVHLMKDSHVDPVDIDEELRIGKSEVRGPRRDGSSVYG